MHFGILGMKWGVRRYQNPDGTLTPAGKRRYNELNAKADYYKQKADNKYHEIYAEGKDSIVRAISADAANTKSKILRKKAEKYGTIEETEYKNAYQRIRNTFKTDEMKDKWQHAIESRKFPSDFSKAMKEQKWDITEVMEEYAEYLNDPKLYMKRYKSFWNYDDED